MVASNLDKKQIGTQLNKLEKQGYQVKSVTTISEIVISLMSTEALPRNQANEILRYLRNIHCHKN
jgi:hypothetical protein